MKIYPVSLGCPKNRTDTEKLLALLVKQGGEVVLDPAEADLLLVNTCAFLQEAVEESIDVILELAEEKRPGQRLVVCGCLVARYGAELPAVLPEVDLFVGVEPYRQPGLFCAPLSEKLVLSLKGPETPRRLLTESPFYAYLKVADGCRHACSFCLIPRLRGPLRSVPEGLLEQEAQGLLAQGVRELILVAQDVSAYGLDQGQRRLPGLIKRLAALEGLSWLRLLYLHPEGITDELLEALTQTPKVCPYFDIPIQHASARILKAMRRPADPEALYRLFTRLRKLFPDAGLRTAVIVGFPGETEKDFAALLDFIKAVSFDHLGAFVFSPEEGTLAAKMPQQVPEEVKWARFHQLMALQKEISRKRLLSRQGQEIEVLVEGIDDQGRAYGHAVFQAPEIDGQVLLTQGQPLPGEIVRVRVKETTDYDLWAELAP